MTPLPLTFWQARILLLMTQEPQSLNDVTHQLATHGKVLRLSRLEIIIEELRARELLGHLPQRDALESRYWLRSGPAAEEALHEAYGVVKNRKGPWERGT
ncbi:hypothetical protein DGo_PB0166 (plasmid) [Deinococcus gobiensis I-0]|uniref:Uncharacterized protein n=2 Tax=Deinococcus TaxID=1298 RepID=H8H1N8_DEIGI|nr:hypothetical protein DGo_PB0166 [Deinococcus gobiensis I-0]